MRQRYPLLNYQEPMTESDPCHDLGEFKFNIISGLWFDETSRVLISSAVDIIRETTKTASVEGIDQSEISHMMSTNCTRTREGSDQTESSLHFSTIITESRTSPDKAEGS